MTEEEILAMEAGEELDIIVAKEIMGQHGVWRTDYNKYSTDIAAAWQVWVAVTKDALEDWAIYPDVCGSHGEVTVEHYPDDYKGEREESCGDFDVSGPFPEAICKAALLAKLREVK